MKNSHRKGKQTFLFSVAVTLIQRNYIYNISELSINKTNPTVGYQFKSIIIPSVNINSLLGSRGFSLVDADI